MYDEMKQYIQDNQLLTPAQNVLLAVSGGPDSMVMAHLFFRLRQEWDLTLRAVQLNHKLRPTASEESALVASYMDKLSIPFICLEHDISETAISMRIGIEEAGHIVRKTLFEEIANNYDCTAIALAHHMDDRAETILMNLFRGSGLSGLSAMRPCEGLRIRPLLFARKSDILDYARAFNIPYAIDESNADPVFLRNRIRHEVLPLATSINQRAVEHIALAASSLEEVEKALDDITDVHARMSLNLTVNNVCSIRRDVLSALPVAIQKRMLLKMARILQPERISLSQKVVDQVIKLVATAHTDKCIHAGNDLKIYIECYDVLFVINSLQDHEIRYDINWDFYTKRKLVLSGSPVRFQVRSLTEDDTINKTIFLPSTSARFFRVRTRKAEDVMAIAGVGHKRIKKIFQESDIPLRLRDRWPLVCDENNKVLWIPGVAVADNATNRDTKDAKTGICIESVFIDASTWNKIIAEAIQEDVNE